MVWLLTVLVSLVTVVWLLNLQRPYSTSYCGMSVTIRRYNTTTGSLVTAVWLLHLETENHWSLWYACYRDCTVCGGATLPDPQQNVPLQSWPAPASAQSSGHTTRKCPHFKCLPPFLSASWHLDVDRTDNGRMLCLVILSGTWFTGMWGFCRNL